MLLVAGILFALQIDKWNKIRKDRLKETEVIENLVKKLLPSNKKLQFTRKY